MLGFICFNENIYLFRSNIINARTLLFTLKNTSSVVHNCKKFIFKNNLYIKSRHLPMVELNEFLLTIDILISSKKYEAAVKLIFFSLKTISKLVNS